MSSMFGSERGTIILLDRDGERAQSLEDELHTMPCEVAHISDPSILHDRLKSKDHNIKCIVASFADEAARQMLYHLLETTNLRLIIPAIFYDADETHNYQEALEHGAVYVIRKNEPLSMVRSIALSAMTVVEEHQQLKDEVRRRTSAIGLIQSGEFQIQTLDEARNLATMLSLACPNPETVALGLVELIVNGIEHGNLGISYEDKTRLVQEGRWTEEVLRRLTSPENAEKYVTVLFLKVAQKIRFRIIDCGDGFDFSNFLEFSPENITGQHGRGILMARAGCFDHLEYVGRGNEVIVEVHLPEQAKS